MTDAIERCARLPSVTAAAFADSLPPGDNGGLQTFSREDRPLPEPGHRGDNMLLRGVTADYFRAMGIPLLRGRTFAARDAEGIVIVNQALARRYFPDEEPLGKRIGGGQPDLNWKTIVGVVGNEKNDGLRSDPQPEAYLPISIEPGLDTAWLVVRTAADPLSTAAAMRAELRDLDRTLPITVRTMPEEIGTLLARPRFQTLMMTVFSLLALAMAAIGVYGVASWAVAQRRREIGVRMALGASPGDVLRLIMREAAGPLALGLIAGIAGALVLGRYIESMLFGIRPGDAITLSVAASVLAGAVLVATYVPARRAARGSPAVTLRSE